MWPFTAVAEPLWLLLYVFAFALHAVFVSYVAAGTGYALVQAVRRADDPLAARVRDWLPFMLGAGITAGVGPLLFVQLLYQQRFYTANLLMGPRWGAVVPALIVGFYALYLAKAKHGRARKVALGVGLACFAFVAWSWTELHVLMAHDAAWREMYARGSRVFADASIAARLALWLGAMLALFATVAAWSASAGERTRLAVLALIGLGAATIAGLASGGFDAAHGWTYLLLAAVALAAVGWVLVLLRPEGGGISLAIGASTAALLAGAVVREAPRLALVDVHPRAHGAGGAWLFAATLVIGITAIVWIVRTARAAD
jgi:hypothetical protein